MIFELLLAQTNLNLHRGWQCCAVRRVRQPSQASIIPRSFTEIGPDGDSSDLCLAKLDRASEVTLQKLRHFHCSGTELSWGILLTLLSADRVEITGIQR